MTKIRSEKTGFWLGLLFILACSFIVFFYRYGEPKGPVWDEPYHIASAEKYLNKVMFMEVHPPLGKLFIALGEKMFNPNASLDKSNFLSTDYIDTFPDGYSFIGVRFFPTLFSALSAAILFLIFFVISKRPFLSFVSSSFYIFDNAIVSHFRGAMLDGIQLFFILAAILYFIYTYKTSKTIKSFQYLILGVLSGLAIATKVTALILILLLPALFLAKERIIFSNKCLNSFLIKSLFLVEG
jgi:dolichyl-phosphate-mannose--protein O-mannosyl transferase